MRTAAAQKSPSSRHRRRRKRSKSYDKVSAVRVREKAGPEELGVQFALRRAGPLSHYVHMVIPGYGRSLRSRRGFSMVKRQEEDEKQ